VVLFSSGPLPAYGAQRGFVFNNAGEVSKWRFEHVDRARLTEGGLLLEGNNYIRIAPPIGFSWLARRVAVELRFHTPKSLICNIRVKASDGLEYGSSVKVKSTGGGRAGQVLRLYLGKHRRGTGESHINDFVLEFYSTESVEVRLDSLRFYEPAGLGLVSLLWGRFWTPDFIMGTTVGFVTTPSIGGLSFLSVLYIVIAAVFILVLIICKVRGEGLSSQRLARFFVLIVLFFGLLFAVRMDYNWLSIFSDDVRTLSKMDVDRRIRIVNQKDLDTFFDFIKFVKESVPPQSSVRPATIPRDAPLAAIARYYLLPLEDSATGGFLWSYGQSLRIDPSSGALYDEKGRLIAPKVRPYAVFAKNAQIYEVIK